MRCCAGDEGRSLGAGLPGSFGYRPKRTAHDAIKRGAEAIVQRKTRVLDIDLRAYFDNVRHDRLLEKVAQRVDDAEIMHLLKVMLKASGPDGSCGQALIRRHTKQTTMIRAAHRICGFQ